jgi:general secretion pathway protein J
MIRVSSQAGFTLAETLVAFFILALVSASGASLLVGATGAGKQIRQAEAEARQVDIAQALIRQDIAAMSERAVLPDVRGGRAGNLFGESRRGSETFLQFVRDGWLNPGEVEARSDLQLVRYRLENNVLIREAVTRPDATNGTPMSERALLSDVSDVELSFYRGGERSEAWVGDAGQPLHLLPELIEMTIVFTDGPSLTIAALTGGRT